MRKVFSPGDRVTSDLNPDYEILTVIESRPNITSVRTFDGIVTTYATQLLSLVRLPVAAA